MSEGMSRLSLRIVAFIALVVASGCLSGPVATQSTTTDTPTSQSPATTTATDTPVSTRCGPTLYVESVTEADIDINRTLDYSNLSAARQSEFSAAVENRTAAVDGEWTDTWSEPTIVTYNEAKYRATVMIC